MLNKFAVLDDFIPPSYQEHLHSIFYQQVQGQMWSFSSLTSGGVDLVRKFKEGIKEYDVEDGPQMVCMTTADGQVYHQSWFDLRPITWFAEQATGMKITRTNRCKVNLNPLDSSWHKKIHTPHSDIGSYIEQNITPKDTAYSLIYYIKDADGPTVIFDRTIDDFLYKKLPLKVIGEITPKMGRAVLLPSDLLHSGTNPTKSDCRIVVNFVFHTEEKVNFESLI